MQDEWKKCSKHKMKQLEFDNKDLKDRNDELTAEVEGLKMDRTRSGRSRKSRNLPGLHGESPQSGSPLHNTIFETSDDDPEFDSDRSFGFSRPIAPGALYTEKLQVELDETKKEREKVEKEYQDKISDMKKERDQIEGVRAALQNKFDGEMNALLEAKKAAELARDAADQNVIHAQNQHKQEQDEMRRGFAMERKEIGDSYQIEIAKLEDHHREETDRLIDDFEREKDELIGEMTRNHEAALMAELTRQKADLDAMHQRELNEVDRKYRDTVRQLEHKLEEDRRNAEARLQDVKRKAEEEEKKIEKEHADELVHQRKTLNDTHQRELGDAERKHDAIIQQLERKMTNERQKAVQRLELDKRESQDEKRQMELKHADDKKNTIERLNEQHKDDINHQLLDKQNQFDLEKRRINQDHDRDKKSLEKKYLDKVRELQDEMAETEIKHLTDLADMKKRYEEDKKKMLEKHIKEIDHYEDIIEREGERGLGHGKLKDDFDDLLRRKNVDFTEQERRRLSSDHEFEKKKKDEEMAQEKNNLLHEHSQKIYDYEKQMLSATEQHEQDCTSLEDRLKDLEKRYGAEKDEAARRKEADREEAERLRREAVRDVERQLQDKADQEHRSQVERLQSAFNDERSQKEQHMALLQADIDEQKRSMIDDQKRKQDDAERKEDSLQREAQRYRRLMEDGDSRNKELAEELARVQSDHEAVKRKNPDLESQLTRANSDVTRANRKHAELESQLAMVTEELEAARRTQQIIMEPVNVQHTRADPNRDKVILDALSEHNCVLETRADDLRKQIEELSRQGYNPTNLQLSHNEILKEQRTLNEEFHKLNAQVLEAVTRKPEDKIQERQEDYYDMKDKLSEAEERISRARSDLARAETSHLVEVEKLRSQVETTNDTAKYQNLNLVNEQQQRKIWDLEDQIIKTKPERLQQPPVTEKLDSNADREVRRLKDLLQDHVYKLNVQLQKTTKSDLLVTDLYTENAQLMKTIEKTEQREKIANKRILALEDKCSALQDLVREITMVALENR